MTPLFNRCKMSIGFLAKDLNEPQNDGCLRLGSTSVFIANSNKGDYVSVISLFV